jgi:hypothetical protein
VDTAVPTMVGVEVAVAAEGALLLRAQSRTWRPVPGSSSGEMWKEGDGCDHLINIFM